MKLSWTSEFYQKVQQENDNVQGFDTQWDEVLSAVTDRPTDSMLESVYNMQVEQLNEIKYLLQFHLKRRHFGDNKMIIAD